LGVPCRPKHVYSLAIANEKLVRQYIKALIDRDFVRLYRSHGCRFLRPTLDGLALTNRFFRELRQARHTFLQD